jgi:hypothetical protein
MRFKLLPLWSALTLITASNVSGLIIEDFSLDGSASPLRNQWQGFTDRVMGGRSDMQAGIIMEDGETFLRMRGLVTTENNGGFIQVRLAVDPSQLNADFNAYSGVRIRYRVRKPGNYLIHLRTRHNLVPWSYYSAILSAGDGWQESNIPWNAFRARSTLRRNFNPDDIRSFALVAAEDDFEAEIDLQVIALYN